MIYDRIFESWRQLSPTNRWLLAGVLVSLVVFAAVVVESRPDAPLVSLYPHRPLAPAELAIVDAALATDASLEYDVQESAILVPQHRRAECISIVRKHDAAPKHLPELLSPEQAWSVFEPPGQRQARMNSAMERGLANCLREMASIRDAVVHIDQETTRVGLRRRTTTTAMVVLHPASELSVEQLLNVRQLVAAAEAELSVEQVTVIDLTTEQTYSGSDERVCRHFASVRDQQRRQQEQERWNQRIRRALGSVPGIRVETTLGPSTELSHQEMAHVALGVPESYIRAVWHEQTGEEWDPAEATHESWLQASSHVKQTLVPKIRQLFLGAPPPVISVAPAFDDESPSLPPEPEPTGRWWWGAGVAALLALILAGGAVRGLADEYLTTPSSAAPAASALQVVEAADEPRPRTTPAAPRPHEAHDVQHKVRENPTAAAARLREWMDRAG